MPWVPVQSPSPSNHRSCFDVKDAPSPLPSPSTHPVAKAALCSKPQTLGTFMPRRRAWADLNSDSDSDEVPAINVKADVTLSRPLNEIVGNGGSSSSTTSPSSSRGAISGASGACEPTVLPGCPVPATSLPSSEPSHLVAELAAMAARLLELSGPVQLLWPSRRSAATAPAQSGAEIQRLVEVAEWCLALQAEATQHAQQAQLLSCAAEEGEQLCADILAAGNDAQQPDSAMLLAEASFQAAMALASAATQQAQQNNAGRAVQALRAQVLTELDAAAATEAKAQDARDARQAVQMLPELRKKRKAAEKRASDAEILCEELRRSVASSRAETAEAAEAFTVRLRPLELRVATLDRECHELQSFGAANAPSQKKKKQPVPAQTVPVLPAAAEELLAAQANNRELISEAREARHERDRVTAALEKLQEETDGLRQASTRAAHEGADLYELALALRAKEADARAEVVALRSLIRKSEGQVQVAETAARKSRERKAEVDADKRRIQNDRRKAEEEASILEHKLQKALAKHEKDKLTGASLPRPLGGAEPRQQGLGGKRFGSAGSRQTGCSDAELDSTTAASESLADYL